MLSGLTISAHDQLIIEFVNRARANPNAEAARFGVGLNSGVPSNQRISSDAKQPLAPNQALSTASLLHSQDMLDRNYFSHTARGPAPNGSEPQDRAESAGYDYGVGENLSWTGTTGTLNQNASVADRHESLFTSVGHRINMMVEHYVEIGAGIAFGQTSRGTTTYNAAMVTNKFGVGAFGGDNFITGVVFQDATSGANNDSFYSIGEGRTGTVRAFAADGTEYTGMAGTAGGYGLQVPDGTYSVQFTRAGVDYLVEGVTVSGENVKVDFELTTAARGSFELPVERPNAGDSPVDFVARNENGTFIVFEGQAEADGTITLTADNYGNLASNVDWEHVSYGDFNGDGLDDVAGWDPATGDWQVGLSDGDRFNFSTWERWSTGGNWRQIQVGDFNGDGLDDLAGRTGGGSWYIAESDGQSFDTNRWGAWSRTRTWDDVSVGDFNGDGKDDLVARNDANTWYVSRSNAAGDRFVTGRFGRWNPGIEWSQITVGDFNNDGRTDLAAVIETSGSVYVARSTGTRFVTQRWGIWDAGVYVDIVSGDFNGDGIGDLAGRATDGGWSLATSNGSAFTTDRDAGQWDGDADWSEAFVADLNGDGIEELLAFNANQGRLYAGDPFFGDIQENHVGSLSLARDWTDLAIADFDA